LVACGATPDIEVFDSLRNIRLRKFVGHSKSVHWARFFADDNCILSVSDDVTIRFWDLPTGRCISGFRGHSDCIRTAGCTPIYPSTFLSGSYDHTVRFWDVRTKSCWLTVDHGEPVEDVMIAPCGSLAISVGGTSVRVWALAGKSRLLHEINQNNKPLTCAKILIGSSTNSAHKIVTGNLGGVLTVYDSTEFRTIQSLRFRAPILCLTTTPDMNSTVVGTSEGSSFLYHHSIWSENSTSENINLAHYRAYNSSTYRYYQNSEITATRVGSEENQQQKKIRILSNRLMFETYAKQEKSTTNHSLLKKLAKYHRFEHSLAKLYENCSKHMYCFKWLQIFFDFINFFAFIPNYFRIIAKAGCVFFDILLTWKQIPQKMLTCVFKFQQLIYGEISFLKALMFILGMTFYSANSKRVSHSK